MDYYEKKFQCSGDSIRSCCYSLIMIVVALIIAVLCSSCRTVKVVETTDTRDSVRTEYIEKIVKDTVTVTVEIPAESKERETRDSVSNLETSMASSTAALIWRDGTAWLVHSLKNKPQTIQKPVEVEAKEKTKTVYKTHYVTKYKTVEKQLPWWKKALMWAGAVESVLIILIITVFFIKH